MKDNSADISTLLNFLDTGNLGNLSFGLPKDATLQRLGKPLENRVIRDVVPNAVLTVLDYGNLEIAFIDEEMYILGLYFREYPKTDEFSDLPPGLSIGWYNDLKATNVSNFITFLKNHDIEAKKVLFQGDVPGLASTIVIEKSGVELIFNEDGQIDSILFGPSVRVKREYETP